MRKKLNLITILSFLLIFTFTINISASTHSGGYNKSVAKNLSVKIYPSVKSFGDNLSLRINQSLNKMTGVSSKLGWHQSSSDQANITITKGKYSQHKWYGNALYYCKSGTVEYPCNKGASPRVRTAIRLNHKAMENANFNYNNKYKTILHEIGHALSLDHINSGASVMRSGKFSYTSPQTIDKNNLKSKWGN